MTSVNHTKLEDFQSGLLMPLSNSSRLQVQRCTALNGSINLPSSKSTSTRAILTAAITPGRSAIHNLATGMNTTAMRTCVGRLGAAFSSVGPTTLIDGVDVRGVDQAVTLDPGNSGVVLRLLMGVTGLLSQTHFRTDYGSSLGKRSQAEMVDALGLLGVRCSASGPDATLPITIHGGGPLGRYTEVSCRKSSQFLSGLLYLGALSETDLEIKVTDTITAPSMVHTTINNLRRAGVVVGYDEDFRTFNVEGRTMPRAADYSVGADPASTAAVLGLCSSVSSEVVLNGFFEEELGNGAVIDYLAATGSRIKELEGDRIQVLGSESVKAMDFNGSLAPDAVPALAARAAFADGTSVFHNVEHIRYKESNRISDFRREVAKIGVRTEETVDQLIIHGSPLGYEGGVTVDSHFDHGLIMAFTTIAARCRQPVVITDPVHVGQTYPEYFDDVSSVGMDVRAV